MAKAIAKPSRVNSPISFPSPFSFLFFFFQKISLFLRLILKNFFSKNTPKNFAQKSLALLSKSLIR